MADDGGSSSVSGTDGVASAAEAVNNLKGQLDAVLDAIAAEVANPDAQSVTKTLGGRELKIDQVAEPMFGLLVADGSNTVMDNVGKVADLAGKQTKLLQIISNKA